MGQVTRHRKENELEKVHPKMNNEMSGKRRGGAWNISIPPGLPARKNIIDAKLAKDFLAVLKEFQKLSALQQKERWIMFLLFRRPFIHQGKNLFQNFLIV
nr:hypothetical protein [Tanacetum cinerariifolium]